MFFVAAPLAMGDCRRQAEENPRPPGCHSSTEKKIAENGTLLQVRFDRFGHVKGVISGVLRRREKGLFVIA